MVIEPVAAGCIRVHPFAVEDYVCPVRLAIQRRAPFQHRGPTHAAFEAFGLAGGDPGHEALYAQPARAHLESGQACRYIREAERAISSSRDGCTRGPPEGAAIGQTHFLNADIEDWRRPPGLAVEHRAVHATFARENQGHIFRIHRDTGHTETAIAAEVDGHGGCADAVEPFDTKGAVLPAFGPPVAPVRVLLRRDENIGDRIAGGVAYVTRYCVVLGRFYHDLVSFNPGAGRNLQQPAADRRLLHAAIAANRRWEVDDDGVRAGRDIAQIERAIAADTARLGATLNPEGHSRRGRRRRAHRCEFKHAPGDNPALCIAEPPRYARTRQQCEIPPAIQAGQDIMRAIHRGKAIGMDQQPAGSHARPEREASPGVARSLSMMSAASAPLIPVPQRQAGAGDGCVIGVDDAPGYRSLARRQAAIRGAGNAADAQNHHG